MSIMGNIAGLAAPQPDWNQTDAARADYIKNKPQLADLETLNQALTLARGALARSGGAMTGPIAMGGQGITGLAEPAAASDAATKGYADSRTAAAAAVLGASLWQNQLQTVSAAEVTADNVVIAAPDPASWESYGDAGVRAVSQETGKVTFACRQVPAVDLTVQLLILK